MADTWLPRRFWRHEEPKPPAATLANWVRGMELTIPASDICCPIPRFAPATVSLDFSQASNSQYLALLLEDF